MIHSFYEGDMNNKVFIKKITFKSRGIHRIIPLLSRNSLDFVSKLITYVLFKHFVTIVDEMRKKYSITFFIHITYFAFLVVTRESFLFN